uniref:homing endonuclease n=1 Tax=Leptographium wingfieldii TaxID=155675 RepID=UPI0023F0980C
LLISILSLLLSNAVTIRRDISILFNRVAIIALAYSILHSATSLFMVSKGIGLHGGLLNITSITQIFDIFIFLVSILILQLTSFFPRKVWVPEHSSLTQLFFNKFVFYRTKIINKMGEHLRIIEYPEQKILRDELSNSGELLKLLIPNLENIFRGGWTNYSGMVTSQKMVLLFYLIKYNIYGMCFPGTLEIKTRKMDNRGSKSIISKDIVVKEQRVDGSWLLNFSTFNSLRCTLRRFERITLSGSISYQILNKRLYSNLPFGWGAPPTAGSLPEGRPKAKTTIMACSAPKDPKNIKSFLHKDGFGAQLLNPWFVTGFIDGDGSFAVSITKKKEGIGWKIVPMFTIGLDQKDLDLLVQIKDFFKTGNIYTSKRGVTYYTVGSVKDIVKYILPHFEKFPLVTQKLKDFILFKEIVLIMEKGEHNTLPGLLKVFSLKVNLNKGLSTIVKEEFTDIKPAVLPEFQVPLSFNPNWIAGFITAEGSFFIFLYANEKRKAGYAVSLSFSLSQHLKDIKLLERLAIFLDCGVVRIPSNREAAELIITKSSDLNQKLIPLLKKYNLSGVKLLDFERFREVSLLIENKMHLTYEGIVLIKTIKDAMYNR